MWKYHSNDGQDVSYVNEFQCPQKRKWGSSYSILMNSLTSQHNCNFWHIICTKKIYFILFLTISFYIRMHSVTWKFAMQQYVWTAFIRSFSVYVILTFIQAENHDGNFGGNEWNILNEPCSWENLLFVDILCGFLAFSGCCRGK